LLLVTVIVVLVLGWWVEHRRVAATDKKHQALVDFLEKTGYPVSFDSGGRVEFTPPWQLPNTSAPAPNPPKP